MYIKKMIVFCYMLLLSTLFVYPINFKHIGVEGGLSHFSVSAIYQDIHGRMWFGTHEGITVYDGSSLNVFKPSLINEKEGELNRYLTGNKVTAIIGNKDGNVFLIVDDVLIKYDINKQTFNKVRKETVNALTASNGKIYCAYNDSVYVYDEEKKGLVFFLKTGLEAIQRIFIVDKQYILLGTNLGVFLIDGDRPPRCVLPSVKVFQIYKSTKNEIWISTWRDGLYKMMSDGGIVKMPYKKNSPYGISTNYIRGITEDNSGNLWFGSFDGLQKYNPFTGEFTLHKSGALVGNMSDSSVHPIYKDNQGTLWIGTYWGGVNYFNPEKDMFSFYPHYSSLDSSCLNYPLIGNIVEDKDEKLWICTEGGGLNCLDRKSRTFTYYVAADSENSLPHNNLKTICYDRRRHRLYIGTHTGGLSRFDITTKKFKNYLNKSSVGNALPNDIIHKVMCYNNKLVVAARNGLFLMDLDTDAFIPIKGGRICLAFDIDPKGYMWMICNDGIWCLNLNNLQEYNKTLLSGVDGRYSVTNILADDEDVYCGTFGAGIYRLNRRTNKLIHYTAENDQLLSNYCYNILKTRIGNLLVTTDKGIMLFHPDTKMLKSIHKGVGIPLGAMASDNGVYECANSELFIGGTNGMVSFWEDDIDNQSFDYNILFTNLFVNNQLIYPDDETQILNVALPFTKSVDLDYTQNNLNINFAVSNYVDIYKSNQYEYKLDGFDENWMLASTNSLHYTNLLPGEYVLKVRELQPAIGGVAKETSISIVIHSPWYDTLWAWMFYVISCGLILYSIWNEKDKRMKLSMSLWQERKEKEQVEMINQTKFHFFTNISHEFRTPLTLILSHIDTLLQGESLSPTVRLKIRKIYKHCYRMKHLITELLDFRKFDQQRATLNVSEHNIVSYLRDIFESFTDYAKKRDVFYRFYSDREYILCWFDERQLQKVFFNLLSNAFKYTQENGHIDLVIEEQQEQIIVRIIDDGKGLSIEDKERVFDCFYQVENQEDVSVAGTGIGLALSKSIVMMHQAEIIVESQLGYGSVFAVTFKKGNMHFLAKSDIVVQEGRVEPTVRMHTFPDLTFMEEVAQMPSDLTGEQPDMHKYTILLIEDNEELMQILIALFAPFYHVISAFNGKEGLDKANSENPDLIVSDVMMPEMSGTEMCFMIKNNIHLCHIPVILLSALNSDEQSLEGLKCGADDYVGKPFNGKILLLKCANFMRNRTLMQGKLFAKEVFDVKQLATNVLDRNFLDKIVKYIEANLDNESFDVDLLAQEMALGRSSFFTKFKGLTGMTPNNFILDFKLKKAAEWLTDVPDLQIIDIALRLGFSTSHYFSKCFKAKFNLSPSEYRKGGNQNL